ncbi:MAG: Gfo/Idh/MocA family oxidoreductase [Clostridiales bacterium]|nr:Gfo/Idh/MocA family oxidoreductase [Clostridiales bacterium]
MINIAILGCGGIARTMAKTLRGMAARDQSVCLYAVAARDGERAKAFAQEEGFQKAFGSYEEMLKDDGVQLVYVATPHSHHAEHVKLCLKYNRPVLCEKAFTGNARQAREVLRLAKEKQVFITEAIWTRYMPSRTMINDLIAAGEIGEPIRLTANLGYAIAGKERIYRPDLAGGALLDLGVYVLNFASMVFGDEVAKMESIVKMYDTGVDRWEDIILTYKDGKSAHLTAVSDCATDRNCVVYGTKGCLKVDNVNNPQLIKLYADPTSDTPTRVIPVPEQITGYEYEVYSCIRALENGELECPEMPHAETIRMMDVMDQLRSDWGMVYPFD